MFEGQKLLRPDTLQKHVTSGRSPYSRQIVTAELFGKSLRCPLREDLSAMRCDVIAAAPDGCLRQSLGDISRW